MDTVMPRNHDQNSLIEKEIDHCLSLLVQKRENQYWLEHHNIDIWYVLNEEQPH